MERQGAARLSSEPGYAMAVLLVGIAVMAILMTAAMPVYRHAAKREKEAELVFRGEQYARAIGLFQRKYAGAFPPSLDVLLEQKFLRKKYKDPMAAEGEFQILYQAAQQPGQPAGQPGAPGGAPAGQASGFSLGSSTISPSPRAGQAGQTSGTLGPQGGIIGVASKSKDRGIRLYKGRERYNEWQFVYVPVTQQPGVGPGGQQPGSPGQRGPGQPGGPVPGQPGLSPRPGGLNPGVGPRPPMTPGGSPNPAGSPTGPFTPGRRTPPPPPNP